MPEFAAQTRRRNDQTFLCQFEAESWDKAREHCGRHGLEKLERVVYPSDETPVGELTKGRDDGQRRS